MITAERGATARFQKAAREAGVGALAQRSVHSSRCGDDSFPVDMEPSAQRQSYDAKAARPVMAVGGGIWPATPPESLDRNGRQVPRVRKSRIMSVSRMLLIPARRRRRRG